MRQFRRSVTCTCVIWILLLHLIVQLLLISESDHRVDGYSIAIPMELGFAVLTAAVKLKLILVKVLFALRTIGLLRNYHSQNRHRHKRSATTSDPDMELEPHDERMNEIIGNNQVDILDAWDQLEAAAHQTLDFDLSYCRLGVLAPHSVGHAPQELLREYRDNDGGKRRKRSSAQKPKLVNLLTSSEEEEADEKNDSSENLLLFFDSREDEHVENIDKEEGDEREYELVYDDGQDDYELDELEANKQNEVEYEYEPEPDEIEDVRTIDVSYSEFVSATIGSMMGNMHGCEILHRGLRKTNRH